MESGSPKLRYTAVTGYFKHDAQPTDPSFEATTLPALGLIDREYETDKSFDPLREKSSWERFAYYLDRLNEAAGGNAVYKLLYAARHGQGYHNVKELEVGTAAWESYWAKLDGDDKMTWADAHLTQTGISQAKAMNSFWEDAAVTAKLPLARRHYASPHARCLETCEIAFSDLTLPPGGGEVPTFKPLIKEHIRERLGIHTCDRRRTRTWIHENHPIFAMEDGFAEKDELWKPDVRETLAEHAVRVKAFLDDLFASDDAPIISVTAHSGTILALYEVIGHPAVRVAPGAIIPVLIKAEVVEG